VQSVDQSEQANAPRPEPSGELLAELAAAALEYEHASAPEIIEWAVRRFGDELLVASSFQDAVLIDLAVAIEPKIEVLFLDTGYHFPETLDYLAQITRRYELNVQIATPAVGLDETPCGSAGCCDVRKVEPLTRMLGGKKAWITGVKRVDTPERTDAAVIGWDFGRGLVKVNPIALWSDADVDDYVAEHHLDRHPLNAQGYISIGCAPTTRPIAIGEDPRAGRWPDSEKTECGLHL
jgi:phosphoadenosine phosphosulfate reductase